MQGLSLSGCTACRCAAGLSLCIHTYRYIHAHIWCLPKGVLKWDLTLGNSQLLRNPPPHVQKDLNRQPGTTGGRRCMYMCIYIHMSTYGIYMYITVYIYTHACMYVLCKMIWCSFTWNEYTIILEGLDSSNVPLTAYFEASQAAWRDVAKEIW